MKTLFDFVNNLPITKSNRQSTTLVHIKDTTDNKNSSVLDKLVFPK